MTREEKQKAIDALKKSAPVMAVTQEEFKDYIQTLNKIMDWLEQEQNCSEIPTGSMDYISKQEVVGLMMHIWGKNFSGDDAMQECIDAIRVMPSVTPQEPQSFKWCNDCKEYDQNKHCCHRYSKVIRDTVAEIKQEPFKPMVEIDLYSVIKQKYIEREVLDKIRAEIEAIIGEHNSDDYDFCSGLICARKIIDKYKGESEDI